MGLTYNQSEEGVYLPNILDLGSSGDHPCPAVVVFLIYIYIWFPFLNFLIIFFKISASPSSARVHQTKVWGEVGVLDSLGKVGPGPLRFGPLGPWVRWGTSELGKLVATTFGPKKNC